MRLFGWTTLSLMMCASLAAPRVLAQRGVERLEASVIPNVTNLKVQVARDSLKWTRLRIIEIARNTATVAPGIVVGQRPAAGTFLTGLKAETLFVSRNAPIATTRPPATAPTPTATTAPTTTHPTPADTPPPRTAPATTPPPAGTITVPTVVDTTTVPNLYNRNSDQAKAALERARLRAGTSFNEYSDVLPDGRILRQEPAAGRVVSHGTNVTIWYSMGRPSASTITVPRVIGLGYAAASDSLRRAHLTVGRVDTLQARDGMGAVIAQIPRQGTEVNAGAAIQLRILAAPTRVPVPNVVGLTRNAAIARLDSAHLVSVPQFVHDAARDSGIIAQKPSPGSLVDARSIVEITENSPPTRAVPPRHDVSTPANTDDVRESPQPGQNRPDGPSKAPPPDSVTVPDLFNLTVSGAVHVLDSVGLTRGRISGENVPNASRVATQLPARGTKVPRATAVALNLVLFSVVPEIRRHTEREARAIVGSRFGLKVETVRAFRFNALVTTQTPLPGVSAVSGSAIDATLAIPIVPPIPTGIALGLLGLVGYTYQHRGAKQKKEPDSDSVTPQVNVSAKLRNPTPPTLRGDDSAPLISHSLVVRFDVEIDPRQVDPHQYSLIKEEATSHAHD